MRYYDLKCNKIIDEEQHKAIHKKLFDAWKEAAAEAEAGERMPTQNERILHAFDNGKLRVELEWRGVATAEDIRTRFALDFMLFYVRIWDYLDGELRSKPTDEFSYSKYAKALTHFEDTIISYTNDAYYDEDGNFVIEEGKNRIIEHALPFLVEQQEEEAPVKPKLKEVKPQTAIAEDSELFGW